MNRFRGFCYLLALAALLLAVNFGISHDWERMTWFGLAAGVLVLIGHVVLLKVEHDNPTPKPPRGVGTSWQQGRTGRG